MASYPHGFAAAIVCAIVASMALASRPMTQLELGNSECKCVIKGPCDLDDNGKVTTHCVLLEQKQDHCKPGKPPMCQELLAFPSKEALMDTFFSSSAANGECKCEAENFYFLIRMGKGKDTECSSKACGEQYRQKKSQKLTISEEQTATWQRPPESSHWPDYRAERSYELIKCADDSEKTECKTGTTVPALGTQEERNKLKEAYANAPEGATKAALAEFAMKAGVAVAEYEYQEPHCIDKTTKKQVELKLCGHEDKLIPVEA